MQLYSFWATWTRSRKFYLSVASIIALVSFCFCAMAGGASHVIRYTPNPPYDNIPITPNTWEQVDLIYYSSISGHRYTNTIQLLRPIAWLHTHHMDSLGSKVTLSMPEFGIVNVMATVKAIRPTQINTISFDWSKRNRKYVIGRFTHYVTDVRTYTFKDSFGHISHITATPNHPFYVKNKHGFVAIENVSDKDALVGAVGLGDKHMDGAMHLVCDKGKHSHCGVAFRGGRLPVSVYNLEVYRRHVYRVGGDGVVVHNGCDDHIIQEIVSDRAAIIIQKAWRNYQQNSYSIFARLERSIANLRGEGFTGIKDLSDGDIFIRTRMGSSPALGHTGIYRLIRKDAENGSILLSRLDIMTSDSRPLNFPIAMRANKSYYHTDDIYLATDTRLINDSTWTDGTILFRLKPDASQLASAVENEITYAINSQKCFGIGYNCHAFINGVLSRIGSIA